MWKKRQKSTSIIYHLGMISPCIKLTESKAAIDTELKIRTAAKDINADKCSFSELRRAPYDLTLKSFHWLHCLVEASISAEAKSFLLQVRPALLFPSPITLQQKCLSHCRYGTYIQAHPALQQQWLQLVPALAHAVSHNSNTWLLKVVYWAIDYYLLLDLDQLLF